MIALAILIAGIVVFLGAMTYIVLVVTGRHTPKATRAYLARHRVDLDEVERRGEQMAAETNEVLRRLDEALAVFRAKVAEWDGIDRSDFDQAVDQAVELGNAHEHVWATDMTRYKSGPVCVHCDVRKDEVSS